MVVGSSLRDLIPEDKIGHVKKLAPVTLVAFEDLPGISSGSFSSIVVLTGVPPWKTYQQAKKEEHERTWKEARTWLLTGAESKILIELRLAGRRRLIEKPDLVVDDGRLRRQQRETASMTKRARTPKCYA